MRYLALALAFASVIIPLNSPQGSKPKTPGSGPREQLNTPNPSDNPKNSDLTNTNKPYQSKLDGGDIIKFFVNTVLAFRIFNPPHQPDLPVQLNVQRALNLAGLVAINFIDTSTEIIKTDNNNPNPNSIKLLISKAEKPELPSPSRYL